MKIKFFTVLTLAIALFMSACGKSDADLTKAATDKLAADKIAGVTVAVRVVVINGVRAVVGEAAMVMVGCTFTVTVTLAHKVVLQVPSALTK